MSALNSFAEGTIGLTDRPLGSDFLALTPKQMIVLATRPEGHAHRVRSRPAPNIEKALDALLRNGHFRTVCR